MTNDIYVVNGSHDESKLINLLYGFIRKFVLCQKCNNPETSLIVSTTNQTIRQKCIACGHEATINKAIHKLTTYIINHPPDNLSGNNPSSKENGSSSSSSSKKPSKSDKKSKKNGSGTGSNSPTNNNNGTQLTEDRINEDFDDFDDFDQNELTTDEYNKRMREICDGFSSGMYMNDLKRESGNLFYKIVKEKKEANLLSDQNVQKELFEEAKRLDIKDKSTLILSELLFTENILDEIKKYKILLLRFCVGNKKAQKYLLGGYEKLVGDVYKDKLLNNAVKILKQFYDEEILDEDVIIEWSAKESKKYVSKEMSKKIHEKVAPLIKWLKEAEVEDSDEESSESSETGNGKSITNKGQHQQQQQRQESVESENDEIDIDFSHRATADCITVESVKPVVIVPINADVVSGVNDQSNTGQDDIDIDNI
jgi:translation initiation factor 5